VDESQCDDSGSVTAGTANTRFHERLAQRHHREHVFESRCVHGHQRHLDVEQHRGGTAKLNTLFGGARSRIAVAVSGVALLSLPACGGQQALPSPQSNVIKLVAPEDIAIASDGSVYFSDFGGNRVFKIELNGKLRLIAGTGKSGEAGDGGPAVAATLKGPAGLAFDRNGNLLVADHDGERIRRIDSQGIITTAFGSADAPFNYPVGLAFDPTGALYVGVEGDDQLQRIDSSGTVTVVDTSSIPGPPVKPGYLLFDPAGNLYVAGRAHLQRTGCQIVRITPAVSMKVIAGTGSCGFNGDGGSAIAAQLDDPNGLAFDSAGNLYFADANNQRIRRIDRNGIITTAAGTGTAGSTGDNGAGTKAELASPFGIAMAPGDLLYIAEGAGKRVRLLNLSSGIITTVAG
jgi:sugar lactone lactonase YvrE